MRPERLWNPGADEEARVSRARRVTLGALMEELLTEQIEALIAPGPDAVEEEASR